MLKSFFTVEEPEDEDKDTGIDWLDKAIVLAKHLLAETIKDFKYRKLAELGNAAVLKTDDTET